MKKLIQFVIISIIILLTACETVRVPIQHTAAAEGSIPSYVKKIAIFPFEYDETKLNPQYSYVKNIIPDKIAQLIINFGTYTIVEREKIQLLLKESMINANNIMESSELEKITRLSGADAAIVGRIESIKVEDKEINKEIEIETGDPDYPTQVRSFPYLIRKVSLIVKAEMLDIKTKQKILPYVSTNLTYNSEEDPNVVGDWLTTKDAEYYENQPSRVPTVNQIIAALAEKFANNFVKKISAHPVYFKIALRDGSTPGMKNGLEWAKNGQYERAIQEFMKSTNDPEEGGDAWYNIGVCYEALKEYKKALDAYEKSNQIKPSSEAIKSIARIRKFNPGL